jgi:hypothetical protein
MTMEKPTKAQRHAIYKKALKVLDADIEYGVTHPYVCIAIQEATEGAFSALDKEDMQNFPEFIKQKPTAASQTGRWWPHDADGNSARRKTLLKCIELTKPTPRK